MKIINYTFILSNFRSGQIASHCLTSHFHVHREGNHMGKEFVICNFLRLTQSTLQDAPHFWNFSEKNFWLWKELKERSNWSRQRQAMARPDQRVQEQRDQLWEQEEGSRLIQRLWRLGRLWQRNWRKRSLVKQMIKEAGILRFLLLHLFTLIILYNTWYCLVGILHI